MTGPRWPQTCSHPINAQTLTGVCQVVRMFSPCQFQVYIYLIQNSQAVKKVCGPQKGYGEKRCEIQGGGQEMAVMVG